MPWAASDFLFPPGFSCNIQNSWGQEGSWRKGSWRPWLCSWDFVICPCGPTAIGPHVHTNFSWLLDVPPHICTSVCVQKTRSLGRIRSWLAILFSAEVQDQTFRPRIAHQTYFHPHLGNPQPLSASPPCPLLHGKETHVQPRREPQDGFQETRRKTSWQNTDRTARAWGRLRKCEGWHKTRKTRYWPLSRGFFPFFTRKSKARWLFCFSFAVISNKQWHHLCEVACPLGGPGQIRWTNECKNAFQVGVVVFCLNLLSHTIL